MKLLKIWAKNVRNISREVKVEIPERGLTILYAPNEFGKSTLAEVVGKVFEIKHSSSTQYLESLQRFDTTQGPTMGMEFEISGKRYSISKTWRNPETAELKQLTPELRIYKAGSESENELSNIKKQSFDEVLWKVIFSPQGQNNILFDNLLTVRKSDFFRNAVDSASQGDGSDSEITIQETVKKAYLSFFTEKGSEAKSEGSKGREIKDLELEIDELSSKLCELENELEEASEIENDLHAKTQNLDELRELFETQQSIGKLDVLKKEFGRFEKNKEEIQKIKGLFEEVESWDEEKYNSYVQEYPRYRQYLELPQIIVKALKAFSLTVDDLEKDLEPNQEILIPVSGGLHLQISDIAEFSFPSNSTSDQLRKSHDTVIELAKELRVDNWDQARERNELFKVWQSVSSDVRDFMDRREFSSDQDLLTRLSNEEQDNPEMWEKARKSDKIVHESLGQANQEVGHSRGTLDSIRKNGVLDQLNNLESRLRGLQSKLGDLELERAGIKLLFSTMESQRSNKDKIYAKLFTEEINSLMKTTFREDVFLHVDEKLNISGRNEKGILLSLNQLSVGAKEQISLLSRVALARIVSKDSPVPLILDDDLVSTDKTRLENIGKVLSKLDDMQIIIFTCHPERYSSWPEAHFQDLEKLVVS